MAAAVCREWIATAMFKPDAQKESVWVGRETGSGWLDLLFIQSAASQWCVSMLVTLVLFVLVLLVI